MPRPVLTAAAGPSPGLVPVETSRPAAPPAGVVGYRVQAGDTVFGISRRLSVPLRSLIDANDLAPPYALSIGQLLRVPNPRKHIVQRGDTVYGISRRYGVDLTELVRLNQIQAPYTIALGQDLILPAPGEPAPRILQAAAPPAPSPQPSPRPAPEPKIERDTQTAALGLPAARPAAIPVPPPRQSSGFLWPVSGTLIEGYGAKEGGQHNDGINIVAPRGTPVRAADNGVVVYAGNELRGFGNLVLIKHAEGWVTAYAHTEKLLVERGASVARGQTIALVGSTGSVSTPQLHFEIRRGTRAVDPARLLGPQSASAQAG